MQNLIVDRRDVSKLIRKVNGLIDMTNNKSRARELTRVVFALSNAVTKYENFSVDFGTAVLIADALVAQYRKPFQDILREDMGAIDGEEIA